MSRPSPRSRRQRRRTRRRAWIAAGVGAVAVVLVGALLVVTRGGSDDTAAVQARDRTVTRVTTGTTVTSAADTTATTVTSAADTPASEVPNAPTAPVPSPASAPYPVGVGRITLEDRSRPTPARGSTPGSASRTLPVTVRYPANGAPGTETDGAAAAAGSFPLVVFAHGFDISAADYAGLLRDLAARGFVVAAPDFPGSSTVFPGPATQSDIDEQARDVAFLVDRFTDGSASGPWIGHVAAGEAGVVGHSDGGNTAARVASNSCCAASRIGAAAVLSGDEGTSGGRWGVAGSPPMLFVQGTADTINPWALSQALYDDAASPKTLVAIEGGEHLAPYTTGPQRAAIVALVAEFLRARLAGDPAALSRVPDLANRDGLRLVASS